MHIEVVRSEMDRCGGGRIGSRRFLVTALEKLLAKFLKLPNKLAQKTHRGWARENSGMSQREIGSFIWKRRWEYFTSFYIYPHAVQYRPRGVAPDYRVQLADACNLEINIINCKKTRYWLTGSDELHFAGFLAYVFCNLNRVMKLPIKLVL